MSDKLLTRSGYVYCVRRSGKTHYRLGHAPAGQLVDRLKKLAQTEENPTTLVLVGWIEVQDYALAARTLRETFHLYRLQDHWFDFRVTKASELKSLLGAYGELMVNLPVAEPLIVHEPQPQYDRSFRFFETLHAANDCAYFPPDDIAGIPVFPVPQQHGVIQQITRSTTKISQTLFNGSRWKSRLGVTGLGVAGLGAVAIGLSSIYGLQASQSPQSSSQSSSQSSPNLPPSSKPSSAPEPQLTPPIETTLAKSTLAKSTPSTPKTQKTNASDAAPPKEPIAEGVRNRPQSTIWSASSEGARLRSNPNSSDDEIDFLPNGTPIALGEVSGAWQEIILPDGRRGWIFNDFIQD